MDPKRLIVKVVDRTGCSDWPPGVIGRLGLASHHLGSLLGAIELTILCAFLHAQYVILMLKLRRLYRTSRRFDLSFRQNPIDFLQRAKS